MRASSFPKLCSKKKPTVDELLVPPCKAAPGTGALPGLCRGLGCVMT